MEQIIEKYFIAEGGLKPAIEFNDFLDEPGTYIFEVLRVISGVPLFLDEHLDRLRLSAEKTGYPQKADLIEVKKKVSMLIKENRVQEGNIKIVFRFYQNKIFFWFYFIPFHYPSEEDYKSGVSVGILRAERENPEAKTIQAGMREKANAMIDGHYIYEVLLVDNQGFIREGSRSNVFFIKGNNVITPPSGKVLNGITRQKVIGILMPDCCTFNEVPVALSDLEKFDCLFLTGTSPKVLPVCRVGNLRFSPKNKICNEIMDRYNRMIKMYISERKQV